LLIINPDFKTFVNQESLHFNPVSLLRCH
jgi:hypothetical protein